MMNLGKTLLSLAAPCLIFLAFLGFMQREGSSRIQSLPAFAVGIGLILGKEYQRQNRRKRLLEKLISNNKDIK